jgi:hypothetical protein
MVTDRETERGGGGLVALISLTISYIKGKYIKNGS